MNKKLILSLAAAGLLASCAVDEQPGSTTALSDNNTIAFNMQTASQSRASQEGSTAAETLGKMFIVWGEKNENQSSGAKAEDADLVFKNYVVAYKDGTASVSNTKGWEYVGVDHSFIHNSADNGTDYVTSNIGKDAAQTIKYWDDNATSYTFTAISALQNDIQNGKVIITKNPGSDATGSSTGTVYDKGYTVQVKKGASEDNIYFSDRNYIGKTQGSSSFDHSKAVSMSFRNFMSKIRFGIYETVPGYKVVITGLKYTTATSGSDNVTTHTSTSTEEGGKTFGVTGNFVVPGDKTQYTVTYEDKDSGKENKAKVTLGESASTATYKNTGGTNWLSTSFTSPTATTNNCVSENAASPTYDKTENNVAGTYTTIMPNPGNKTEMTLTISYDLYSEDTGEKISVDYKTVKVPAQYCEWKSNYAYTYLFKITDDNTGLSPITFDAVVETEDNATWEDITTVDDPSITTFATTTNNKIVTGEYEGGNSIYAVVMDKNTDNKYVPVTLDNKTNINVKLYTVTTNDATNFPITESYVAEAIAHTSSVYATNITATEVKDGVSVEKTVPAEDGTTKTISALKWTAAAGTTYAIEYIKGSGADTKKYYKIVKVAAAASTDNSQTEKKD